MTPLARVSIRPYAEGDVDALYEAVRESIPHVSAWMVWCTPDYSRDRAQGWIRATIAGHASGAMYEFVVIDETGQLAGACGINHINHVDRFANLSYWIRASCTGRGVATAAARAVADWAFAHTLLNRIEIVVAVGNDKSHRVAQKTGALREGVLRQRMIVGGRPVDAVMYSLVRPEASP